MFGKKKQEMVQEIVAPKPILANLPQSLVLKSAIPTIEKEVVEWYIVSNSVVRMVDGKPFYPLESLRRLRTQTSLFWGPYDTRETLNFHQLTNGKERLYTCHWHIRRSYMNEIDKPQFNAYTINETTGDMSFFPSFFAEVLGPRSMQLLKIQAPEKWHTETEEAGKRTLAFLDPEITLEWTPDWK